MGAWIETRYFLEIWKVYRLSLPSWERGLKHNDAGSGSATVSVAPLVGAWIETPGDVSRQLGELVAPLVGAWIETLLHTGIYG